MSEPSMSPVFPIVLFPGWFVEPMPRNANQPATIWVLEPKVLEAFLAEEPVRLTEEDVKLVAFHLSRSIRSIERERSP